jgi:hypothetical protein
MDSNDALGARVTSTLVSRASAAFLLIGGLSLLFAADTVLSRLDSDYPATAFWVGQLLGAAWLGVAALNWLTRSTLLGGIHGRPVVLANVVLHVISAMVILKAAQRAGFPPALSVVAIPALVLAIAYGLLLFRGPWPKDLSARRAG